MARFSTLFGKEFDYEATASGKINPPPVDTPENLRLLSNIETGDDVHLIHVRIGEELSGRLFYERNVLGLELREKGNQFFKQGKYEEALKKYQEATIVNPFDVKNFSNAATALEKLGRNEEVLTMASLASDVDPNFAKVYLLCGKANCNLGFVEAATGFGNILKEKVPLGEQQAYLTELRRFIKEVPAERKKTMGKQEFEETKRRLLSSDQGPPEVYSFLLLHLLELNAKNIEELKERNFPILMKCMTQTPYINTFFEDPASRINQLTPGECRLIGSLLIHLKYHCEDDLATCEKLLADPTFIAFFSKLSFALTKRSTIQTNFANMGPGYLFSCLFSAFIYLLAVLASKYPSLRQNFFKKTPPFDDFGFFLYYVIILQPCFFDTQDSPATNGFIEAFQKVMLEPWCLDKLEREFRPERFENEISLMASVSTIFLQCRSLHFRERFPPFASFLPVWLKLSEHATFCPIMARRPGVWHHFAVRFQYATKDSDAYIELDHHRAHLEETLRVLTNLSKQSTLNSSIFESDEIANHFQTAFNSLLKFVARKSKPRLSAFLDTLARDGVRVLTRMLETSQNLAGKFLISNDDSILQTIAMLAYSKTRSLDASTSAFPCLKMLLKSANSAQITDWENTPNFPCFVEKLVEVLAGIGDITDIHEISLEILALLADFSVESSRLFKVLATSNPYGLVKGLGHIVHKSPALSTGAELLIAKLLPTSIVFSDACSQLDAETSRCISNSVQNKLDSCKVENERKLFEELLTILKA